MKCLNSACSCRTLEGDYCSDLCAAMAFQGPMGPCGCGHAGCSASPKQPWDEFPVGRRKMPGRPNRPGGSRWRFR